MGKMTYKQAVEGVLKQFDSYKKNCVLCNESTACTSCDDDIYMHCDDVCDDNNLICRDKLIQAAEELDAVT